MSYISRLEAKVERYDVQLATKDREIATISSTEVDTNAALKAQLHKLQHERDEFQKMATGYQLVRAQQRHEMKKKERDYIKLQERLNQVLMEKRKVSRSAMDIMNLFQVHTYEAKNRALLAENLDLRSILRSMQMEMRDFLNASDGMK